MPRFSVEICGCFVEIEFLRANPTLFRTNLELLHANPIVLGTNVMQHCVCDEKVNAEKRHIRGKSLKWRCICTEKNQVCLEKTVVFVRSCYFLRSSVTSIQGTIGFA